MGVKMLYETEELLPFKLWLVVEFIEQSQPVRVFGNVAMEWP